MANESGINESEIAEHRAGGSTAIEQATELARSIVDASSLDRAAACMLAAKERIKRITDRLKGPKADARRDWQNWCDLENELIEPYKRIEVDIIKPAIAQFYAVQEEKRREEEDRQRAEAKRREEDKRIAEAVELERDGQRELADAVMAAPVVVAPIVVPQMETPNGVSYRDAWRYEIVDPNQIPREYLAVDEKKIGGVVRALKGETHIPGVRVYCEKIVAGRI